MIRRPLLLLLPNPLGERRPAVTELVVGGEKSLERRETDRSGDTREEIGRRNFRASSPRWSNRGGGGEGEGRELERGEEEKG